MFARLLPFLLGLKLEPFFFQEKALPPPSLADLPSIGIYVHLPFCRTLCAFCPYCKTLYDRDGAAAYKNALVKEVHAVLGAFDSLPPVDSIYFGGGTPALMAEHLPDILLAFAAHSALPQRLAIELHPEDLTPRILEALRSAGINMVSVGIQTFDDVLLLHIQRQQTLPRKGLSHLRDMHFPTVDMDLLFGLPGQTEETLISDFRTAFAYGATQVSTYPFIDFSYASNRRKPQGTAPKKHLLSALVLEAKDLGLRRTAVWTFNQPHTAPYTSVTRDRYLGFGVSAATLLKDRFAINTFHVPAYLRAMDEGKRATALTLRFTPGQRALYHLFWQAYGLDLNREHFRFLTGASLDDLLKPLLPFLLRSHLLETTPEGYRLTEKGALLYHRLEQEVTHTKIDRVWRHLHASPFPPDLRL